MKHTPSHFFVPGPVEGRKRVEKGVDRGRIWTAGEVVQLRDAGVTKADPHKIAEAKVLFNGRVEAVRAA